NRLDAEAQSIDAGAAVLREARGGHGFRVRLERHLAIGGDVERFFAGRDDAGNLGGLEERGRPAAEVDRIGGLSYLSRLSCPSCPSFLSCPSCRYYFRRQRIDLPRLQS